MHYKGTRKTVSEIGDELGVHYVLEGTVRHEADRVRITSQLIQVKDQSQLWAGQYEQSISSILTLQRELAIEIGSGIHFAFSLGGHPSMDRSLVPREKLQHRRIEPARFSYDIV